MDGAAFVSGLEYGSDLARVGYGCIDGNQSLKTNHTRRVLGMGLTVAAHAPVPPPSYGVFRM